RLNAALLWLNTVTVFDDTVFVRAVVGAIVAVFAIGMINGYFGQGLDNRRCFRARSKADVFELHFTAQPFGRSEIRCDLRLALLANQRAYTVERHQPARHFDHQATQVAHGPDDGEQHPRIGEVGADTNGAVDRHDRAAHVAAQHLDTTEQI